jgi:hypothetical protein
MIVTVHLADVGPLKAQRLLFSRLDPERVAGMTYAEPTMTGALGKRPPRPMMGRLGLIAAWENDEAIDRFLADHPFGRQVAQGWHARLEPRRCFGSWAGMPELPKKELPMDDEEPAVALTLGRLRALRIRPFLKASKPAERDAVSNPGVAASIGLTRPALPRLVSTFSVWRSTGEMRSYAFGKNGSHQAAVRTDRAHPFQHEQAFVRFRPYASQGSWDGRDPVAEVRQSANLATA